MRDSRIAYRISRTSTLRAWALLASTFTGDCASNDSARLLFASPASLLECLGVEPSCAEEADAFTARRGGAAEASFGEEQASSSGCPLKVVPCSARGTLWKRGLASAPLPASLALEEGGLCAAPTTASDGATAQGNCTAWHWRWNKAYALEVVPASAEGWREARCLERRRHGRVILAACRERRSQEWIALPRGSEDPTAGLELIQFPVRANGRRVIDASGRTLHLRGINWYGAHMEQMVQNGLSAQPIRTITRIIRHLGFNHVRLSYAVAMVSKEWRHARPHASFMAANPELMNLTVLELFDAAVKAVTDEGLLVIINSHTSDFRWCCSVQDGQGLWYTREWPESSWLSSLTELASRYSNNPRVIGYDIRNEVRPVINGYGNNINPILAYWDTRQWEGCSSLIFHGGDTQEVNVGVFKNSSPYVCLSEHVADWRKGATQGALAVWHGAPEALVFITATAGADLFAAQAQSQMDFNQSCLQSRVVWSYHDYDWTYRTLTLFELLHRGPANFQKFMHDLDQVYEATNQNTNEDWNTFSARRQVLRDILEGDRLPVWVGEFGVYEPSRYWKNFLRIARELDLDWCYWALDAIKYPPGVVISSNYMDRNQQIGVPLGTPLPRRVQEGFGLLTMDYMGAEDTWRIVDLISIQRAVLEVNVSQNVTQNVSQNATQSQPPASCVFEKQRHPVVGTGPHPKGFEAYLKPASSVRGGVVASGQTQLHSLAKRVPKTDLAIGKNLQTDMRHLEDIAKKARTERVAYCTQEHIPWDAFSREEALGKLQFSADATNPVAAALRSPNREEFVAQMQALINEAEDVTTVSIRRIVIGASVALVLMLFCAAFPSKRPEEPPLRFFRRSISKVELKTPHRREYSEAHADYSLARDRVVGCMLAVGYSILALGIIWQACWGLASTVRILWGVDDTICSSMTGVDLFLSGSNRGRTDWDDDQERHSRGFAGLSLSIQTYSELVGALDKNSAVMADINNLVNLLGVLPAALDRHRELLDILLYVSGAVPEGTCGAVDPNLVREVRSKVDLGIGHFMALAIVQGKSLEPRIEELSTNLRQILMASNSTVHQVFETVSSQLEYFVFDQNTLLPIRSLAETVALTFIVLFSIVFPMLLFSLPPAVRFCSLTCCRDIRSEWPRFWPRFVLCSWPTLVVYGTITLGVSSWIHQSLRIGVNGCLVMEDLTVANLKSYAGALQIPQHQMAESMVLECFGTDARFRGKLGNLFALSTAPLDSSGGIQTEPAPLANTLHHYLKEAELWLKHSFHVLTGILDRQSTAGKLRNDVLIDSLLGNASVQSSNPGCSVDLLRLCKAYREAYAEVCEWHWWKKSRCRLERWHCRGNNTSIMPRFLAEDVNQSVAASTEAVTNALAIMERLGRHVDASILSKVFDVADSFDCHFVQKNFKAASDGMCFGVVLGLLEVKMQLFWLGILCFGMGFMMYLVWLRFTQFPLRDTASTPMVDHGDRAE